MFKKENLDIKADIINAYNFPENFYIKKSEKVLFRFLFRFSCYHDYMITQNKSLMDFINQDNFLSKFIKQKCLCIDDNSSKCYHHFTKHVFLVKINKRKQKYGIDITGFDEKNYTSLLLMFKNIHLDKERYSTHIQNISLRLLKNELKINSIYKTFLNDDFVLTFKQYDFDLDHFYKAYLIFSNNNLCPNDVLILNKNKKLLKFYLKEQIFPCVIDIINNKKKLYICKNNKVMNNTFIKLNNLNFSLNIINTKYYRMKTKFISNILKNNLTIYDHCNTETSTPTNKILNNQCKYNNDFIIIKVLIIMVSLILLIFTLIISMKLKIRSMYIFN